MSLITLTTDFGIADHFAGTMKGVILGIAPRARIVDITHAVTPFNILEGAFEIAQAWRYFPRGSIHVCVVDPGVGSARRPLVVAADGHYFIGPDNGIFSMIYDTAQHVVREITNKKMILPSVSRTFHGRDIFAPAAAHLARKTPFERLGKPVKDYVRLAAMQPSKLAGQTWRGSILKTDRFGNLITNFHVHQFPDVKTSPIEVRVNGQRINRFALTYADTDAGELLVAVGSSGYLEIAANRANAAQTLGCRAGDPVELEFA
jgi:S-adenosylmethionine hydrolase